MEDQLERMLEQAKGIAFDLQFSRPKSWKAEGEGRFLVGYMPIYFPREVVHAAGGLAVGILGAGDRMQIIKGDAYYQSYICHIPRGIIELLLNGHLKGFSGFAFPAICDVIRNLSGMFSLLEKDAFVKFMDYPQNFVEGTGGEFYRHEILDLLSILEKAGYRRPTREELNHSIKLYNYNRRLIREIYDLRQEFPWRLSAVDTYHLLRAGMAIPVEEHNEMLEIALRAIQVERGRPMDNIRVVVSGAFCEQPPIGLIRTIEMAGCYIVDDDFLQGMRWIEGDVDENTEDPVTALALAYLHRSTFSSSVYEAGTSKAQRLISLTKGRKADGVLFASPSFCDPALLDRPDYQKALEQEGLQYIGIQYSENTGQFKVIREQVGAFSDSIKLWDKPLIAQ